jgi:hypothetical protein
MGDHIYATQVPGTFAAPMMIMITTVTLGTTTVLPALFGGAIATPIIITTTDITTTLAPRGFAIFSRASMASLEWMGVALATEDWRQHPEPAKQTGVMEGIDDFVSDIASLVLHKPRGDHGGTCRRAGSGLPFIGPIFQTFLCVAKMASEIKNTFGSLLRGAITVQNAIRISGVQVAGLF